MSERGLVKSAQRVMELLEFFDKHKEPVRVSDIVEALDFPQSSASGLLKTLVAMGYLRFDQTGRTFSPTARLAFLGHWALGHAESVEIIQSTMRWLTDHSGESALLGARSGIDMQYIANTSTESALSFQIAVGTKRPLHACSFGISLLSLDSDEEIGLIARRYNAENPNGPPVNMEELMARVKQSREDGVFVSRNLFTQGAGVVSTVIPRGNGYRTMVIGVGGPVKRIDENLTFLKALVIKARIDFVNKMEELAKRPY